MTPAEIPVHPSAAAKFRPDGTARAYPGNTFVAHLDPDSDAWKYLNTWLPTLPSKPGAEAHRFLPADSFHMTLFRGVNDQLRKPGEWPTDLPLDTPLEAVTTHFVRQLDGISVPAPLHMRPEWLGMNPAGDIQLRLVAAQPETARALMTLRQTLAQRLHHYRSGDEHYQFHLTLSYRVRPVDAVRNAALEKYLAQALVEIRHHCPVLVMIDPAFCVFDDMLEFRPIRLLGT